jgi:hypothetical protein
MFCGSGFSNVGSPFVGLELPERIAIEPRVMLQTQVASRGRPKSSAAVCIYKIGMRRPIIMEYEVETQGAMSKAKARDGERKNRRA